MPVLLTAHDGPVRTLTLNRPEVRNALDTELRRELLAALDEAESDPGVRALVLTGAGNAFCAGMDLGELERLLERSEEEHLEDSRRLAFLFRRLYAFPKPVVAAVNGHAIAGGAGLASVCDVVIVSEEAKFGYTEARIGFVAALVSVFLTRMAGERAARELLLGARPVSAGEALAYGLVSEVVEPAKVLQRAGEAAAAMAANSPQALETSKRLLVESGGLGLDDALELAIETNARARSSDDLREGVRAFLEKRPPEWTP
ncbi:MAG TPA: enoyl-CoA hydratase-related protein [Trueperaceae bacterium]